MKRILLCASLGAIVAAGCIAQKADSHDDGDGKQMEHHMQENGATLEFTAQDLPLRAGHKTKWTLKVIDAKGAPVEDFQVAHEKLLHLIVVSKDLSWFNHIHPAYKGKGVFDVQATLPRAGKFKLFADFTPKGGAQQIASREINVIGANPLPATPHLTVGVARHNWFTAMAQAHDEGSAPLTGAARYQVALMPMPNPPRAGEAAMLHFQVRDSHGKPIRDLQPYLGAMGHLVVLSADASTYLHAHPMEDGEHGGHGAPAQKSDVMFHTQFPKAGIYKAWGQFKHRSKIITASFVINVAGAKKAVAIAPAASSARQVTIKLPEGYKDNAVTLTAGEPVKLNFVLTEDAGCGNEIAVPSANWNKTLKVGESATVLVTPKAGVLRFQCGMGMYKGSLKVK